MAYKVVFTELAGKQLESCFLYILFEFNDNFAADAFTKDADETIDYLSHFPNSLPICEDAELKKHGYRMVHFKKHRYKMVYLVKDSTVEIHGVYHNLQDLTRHMI